MIPKTILCCKARVGLWGRQDSIPKLRVLSRERGEESWSVWGPMILAVISPLPWSPASGIRSSTWAPESTRYGADLGKHLRARSHQVAISGAGGSSQNMEDLALHRN